jgi:hypothetical protein
VEVFAEVDERLDPEPEPACLVVLPVLVPKHRPRDIEVRPRGLLGNEFTEEEPGRWEFASGMFSAQHRMPTTFTSGESLPIARMP